MFCKLNFQLQTIEEENTHSFQAELLKCYCSERDEHYYTSGRNLQPSQGSFNSVSLGIKIIFQRMSHLNSDYLEKREVPVRQNWKAQLGYFAEVWTQGKNRLFVLTTQNLA